MVEIVGVGSALTFLCTLFLYNFFHIGQFQRGCLCHDKSPDGRTGRYGVVIEISVPG